MKDRVYNYKNIFLPGSPVKDRKYLLGREQELTDLHNILDRPGQHAIVIGDRGVGKTTLVKEVLRENKYKYAFRTCDPVSSFATVFKNLCKTVVNNPTPIEIINESTTEGGLQGTPLGFGVTVKKANKTYEKYIPEISSLEGPWDVFSIFKSFPHKWIFILDEYDSIGQSQDPSNFHTNVAYLIKQLADNNDECDSRIIVIGVAKSSTALLGKHESIQRSAREIYVRRLRRSDILKFLELSEEDLGIHFDDAVKYHFAHGSLGFPFFLHLVGLECIESMLRRDANSREVTFFDFQIAVRRAVDQAFRAELSKYSAILEISDKHEKAIIDTLAVFKYSHPKRDIIQKEVTKLYGINEKDFDVSLLKLTQEKHFIFMTRETDELRFIDPLMQPFLREKILVFQNKPIELSTQSDQISFLEQDVELEPED